MVRPPVQRGPSEVSSGDDSNLSRTVLLALCGTSPAVVSETVWALFHEDPRIVPSEVVVVTTTVGRQCLVRDLIESGAWQRLRLLLGVAPDALHLGSQSTIQVIPGETGATDSDDVTTPDTANACADFILRVLRSYTEEPGTRVVFSIAGGRKSMSAIAALAMTLLGREHDRLCHVLVNPPYDSPNLEPRFLFPDPDIGTYRLAGEEVPCKPALRLQMLPFPRCRNLFVEQLGRLPVEFAETVAAANRGLAETKPPPRLLLHPRSRGCRIGDMTIDLPCTEYVLFWFLSERRRCDEAPVMGQEALAEAFTTFASGLSTERMPEIMHHDFSCFEDGASVRRLASRLKTRLERNLAPAHRELFLPMRRGQRGLYGLGLPPESIEIDGT